MEEPRVVCVARLGEPAASTGGGPQAALAWTHQRGGGDSVDAAAEERSSLARRRWRPGVDAAADVRVEEAEAASWRGGRRGGGHSMEGRTVWRRLGRRRGGRVGQPGGVVLLVLRRSYLRVCIRNSNSFESEKTFNMKSF